MTNKDCFFIIMVMKKVTIYTDGACSGNPGDGGWGAILFYKDAKKRKSKNSSFLMRIPVLFLRFKRNNMRLFGCRSNIVFDFYSININRKTSAVSGFFLQRFSKTRLRHRKDWCQY